jgi:hypothetical protein
MGDSKRRRKQDPTWGRSLLSAPMETVQPDEIARQMLTNQNLYLLSWSQDERYCHRLLTFAELIATPSAQNLTTAIDFSRQPSILQLGQRRWLEQGKGALHLIDSLAYKRLTAINEPIGMVFNWYTVAELEAINGGNSIAGAVALELIQRTPYEHGQQYPACFSDIPIEVSGCGRNVTLTYLLDVSKPALRPINVAIGKETFV